VGGLTALGLVPLRPARPRVDVYALVICSGLYKRPPSLALVTVNPGATRRIFTAALVRRPLAGVSCLLYLNRRRRQARS